jgi:hypothetical protein
VYKVTVDGTAGHGPGDEQSCAEPTTESWLGVCAFTAAGHPSVAAVAMATANCLLIKASN